MAKIIRSVRELDAYQLAFDAAIEIFRITKGFPSEERFSLTDLDEKYEVIINKLNNMDIESESFCFSKNQK